MRRRRGSGSLAEGDGSQTQHSPFPPPWCIPGQYSELVGRLIEYAISLALLFTVIM